MNDDLEPLGPFHPESEKRRHQSTLDFLSPENRVAESQRVKKDFSEILIILQEMRNVDNIEMARLLRRNPDFYSSYFTIGFFTNEELESVMRAVKDSFTRDEIMSAIDTFYARPDTPDPLVRVFILPPEIEAKLSQRPDSRPPRRTALLQYLFPGDEVR